MERMGEPEFEDEHFFDQFTNTAKDTMRISQLGRDFFMSK